VPGSGIGLSVAKTWSPGMAGPSATGPQNYSAAHASHSRFQLRDPVFSIWSQPRSNALAETISYRMLAAISASGERTERSRVICPNRGEPLNLSMSAAIPPNGEM